MLIKRYNYVNKLINDINICICSEMCKCVSKSLHGCMNVLFLEQQPLQNVQEQSETLMPEALHPTEITKIRSITKQGEMDS